MREFYQFDINRYKQFLLNDLAQNKTFAELAQAISYIKKPASISAWVEGIKGDGLFDYEQSIPASFAKHNLDRIQDIVYQPYYFTQEAEHLHAFFSRKEFSTYQEAADCYRKGSYYVFDRNFFIKIDGLIISNLDGYSKQNDKCYVKRVTDSVYLKVVPFTQYGENAFVNDYVFPEPVVNIRGKDLYFFRDLGESDLLRYLFLFGSSFHFFYYEVMDGDLASGSFTLKRDEPKIYQNKEKTKFILTNSYDKLRIYNKYIYIVLELYLHYFRVFERVLIKQLEENARSGPGL